MAELLELLKQTDRAFRHTLNDSGVLGDVVRPADNLDGQRDIYKKILIDIVGKLVQIHRHGSIKEDREMAVTKKDQYQQQQYQQQNYQQQQYPSQGYQGLAGVSENTAKQAGQAQQGYQPSQNVTQAQQQLQQVQAAKPQGYNSKYGAQLDNIMNQIQNPQEFKYSFDGDELFKYYADLYSQNGRQASMDAMGQAAALTGGYGNSYAQQAGNQAYDEWMRSLYDRGMDLYDRAYQQYRDQQGDLLNQYNVLANQDQNEYGRYRDTVGDWENERAFWADRGDVEAERDYQRYKDNLDYWTGLAQVENADYRNEQARQEAIRQYEQDFAEKVRQADLDESYRRDTLAEQIRQANLDEAYRRDTLDWNKATDERDYNRGVLESDRAFNEQVRQADLDEAYRQSTLAEQIRQANLDESYRRDTLDWNKATDQRNFDEQVRQANLDENYRQSTLAEQIRQVNMDEAYRRDTLDWNKSTDQRDFDEQVRQANLDENYRRDTLAEQQRQANLDESYRRDTLAEQIRQADLDEAYRQNQFDWNKSTDQRNFDEQVRQANLDENYRQSTLAEQIRQANLDENYRRDTLAEQIRQADLDEAYRQNQFDWNKSTDQRNFDEQVRQANMDESYRRDTLAEQQRQADMDEAYRQAAMQWQQETDARDYARNVLESDRAYEEQQRQFDWQMNENIRQFNESLNWDKMSNDQKYAAQYALAILENGQMPSLELLKAAGLSKADAEKLMAQIQPASGGGTTTKKDNKVYYSDRYGNYFYEDKNGNMIAIDESKIPKDAIIDMKYENVQNNLYPYFKGYEKDAKDLLTTVTENAKKAKENGIKGTTLADVGNSLLKGWDTLSQTLSGTYDKSKNMFLDYAGVNQKSTTDTGVKNTKSVNEDKKKKK